MTHPTTLGGGTVNMQFGASAYEEFIVTLSAVNKDAVEKTAPLADCDNMQTISLAGNELPADAAWPLQYTGR